MCLGLCCLIVWCLLIVLFIELDLLFDWYCYLVLDLRCFYLCYWFVCELFLLCLVVYLLGSWFLWLVWWTIGSLLDVVCSFSFGFCLVYWVIVLIVLLFVCVYCLFYIWFVVCFEFCCAVVYLFVFATALLCFSCIDLSFIRCCFIGWVLSSCWWLLVVGLFVLICLCWLVLLV